MKNKRYPLYHLLPKLHNVREMLEMKAKEAPNDIAFRYMPTRREMVEKTYLEFYQSVRSLGTYLLKRGIRGRKIAVIGENSYSWLVAYFAIITTGNVAVLVPKDASPAEMTTLLFQSDSEIVLVSEACQKTVSEFRQNFIKRKYFYSMEDMDMWLDRGARFYERKRLYDHVVVDPAALSTIFFTSGTSGMSKGVMLSQRNMVENINSAVQNFEPNGSVVAVLPFNHAFGLITAIMMPFHYHCPIFLNSNLSNFMREVAIAKPQTLFLVPLFVETFSKQVWRTAEKQGKAQTLRRGVQMSNLMLKAGIDRRKELFDSVLSKFGGKLEYIICGGAALDPHYVKEFRGFGIEILNGYGITECAPVLAVNRNHHFCDGSVGLPLPEVEVRIDQPDETGQGEIVVRGPNVMLGYYNDKRATDEVLRNGWFHTGDLGMLNKDGFLFVTGRKKNLIILSNGENVSPEEIEQLVDRIPEVQEVVVYEEGSSIVAEIYPEETELSQEELKKVLESRIRKLNATLPNHKHIHKIKLRSTEFDKTPTKKIKRYKVGR